MSWGLGWKRPAEIFRLVLNYGTEEFYDDLSRTPSSSSFSTGSSSASSSPKTPQAQAQDQQQLGFRIELDWTSGEDEDQVVLRLQSQLMVALPLPQDAVAIELKAKGENAVEVGMRVEKRMDPLLGVIVAKGAGSGQQSDGIGVFSKLLRSNLGPPGGAGESCVVGCGDHWRSVTLLSLCSCGLTVLPVEVMQLPALEKLYFDNNKLTTLPPELGQLKNLKVLAADNNMLVSVPVELRQCVRLVELSLEHNKLVRPLLDFRAMSELQILRLFGNPLEFLPEILPLHKLRHLSLANIRIAADDNLRSLVVQIEMENSSYFGASKHKLSAFFALIFRFSSCHHPLLASALAKIMQDQDNRVVVGKDENAVRQLISMISSDNRHVVEQACSALSALAGDISVALQLMKCDIMQPIKSVLKTSSQEELVSVLQVVVILAFASDTVAEKLLTKDVFRFLKILCGHRSPEVQRLALLAVGNLAFSLENRRTMVTSESLRELLMRLTMAPEQRVCKAAARALAILGENENLRRAIRGRQIPKQGLRILSMDGGGMKGLATVQLLKEIEKGTGKRIHELFDLICGTSTGGMLAIALGVKLMTLDQCEEIYKNLGKLVFNEPVPKDNESVTWREKLDQLYRSSSQRFRVVVNGSKHSADHFERLLKEMCADEDGDLLIESSVKNIPKVFIVSTLVNVMPAQPFIFRNYQYAVGTPEVPFAISEGSGITVLGSPTTGAQVGYKRSAFIGSCKHFVWQAIRASSAAPYYLDDFSDDVFRWQDGAIVANNPTIFAIREAQLLWPDTKIDCLVSLGCGSVPTKVRKGGWRYLDTGQVLIESACSVDRVEEALSSLLPLLPGIHYFRFNPVDECCDMELDETDPTIWRKLEGAFDEYIKDNAEAFRNVCERLLLPFANDEKWMQDSKCHQVYKSKAFNANESSPSLGWRRNVLLVEAFHSPDLGREVHHARALESFCVKHGIRLSLMLESSSTTILTPRTPCQTSLTTPPITGSFNSSPLLFHPDIGPQRLGHIDSVPPLSLDGLQVFKTPLSSPKSPKPKSPPGRRQLPLPVRSMHEKLQNLPQVGIIHLALQNDTVGSILSWQNDVFVVAEPGELADKFLQSVKISMSSVMRSRGRKSALIFANISTIADLVSCRPYFQVGNVVHRYIGRQTHVMEDDQEIGAYMFRRTVPSMHMTPQDVRCMVGAWRDRIIICTGTFGPTPTMIKSFLDSGAKAVICCSTDPPEEMSCDFNALENVKFEIGHEEETEDDVDTKPSSPMSDWEDIESEKNADHHSKSFWGDDEEELSRFVCEVYDYLFQKDASVDVALRKALASHRRLRYSCHLPKMR